MLLGVRTPGYEKNYNLAMEELNLSKAKELAIRENWNTRLLDYNKEVEDELPLTTEATSLPEGVLKSIDAEDDPWEVARRRDLDGGEEACSSGLGRITMESDGYDDDDDTEYHTLDEGETACIQESGMIKRTVRQLIRNAGTLPDLKHLGDRKVQVNLSYLGKPDLIDRTKALIEDIIKKYISIPGAVITTPGPKEGVFIFNVTNDYFSPQPDTLPVTESPTELKTEITVPLKVDYPALVDDLLTGITLSPKFPGLPTKTKKILLLIQLQLQKT